MVATMNTLATRKLAFWPNDSSTHLPLAARKPTSISRTSMTIFSSTTNPAMFLSLLVVALQAGPTLPSAGGPVGTGVQGPAGGAGGMSPSGRCLKKHPRGAALGGPAYPAGVPISPEKWGERGAGASPWTPGSDSRSFPLAGF